MPRMMLSLDIAAEGRSERDRYRQASPEAEGTVSPPLTESGS